jgi:hypothetical protein
MRRTRNSVLELLYTSLSCAPHTHCLALSVELERSSNRQGNVVAVFSSLGLATEKKQRKRLYQ